MVWVRAVLGVAARDTLADAVKDKRVLYGIRVTIYYGAVTGTYDSLNLVTSGYKQLWRPLAANRLHYDSAILWPSAITKRCRFRRKK